MDTKCVDSTFGEMTYKHRWIKKQKELLFGKEYEVQVVAKAYNGKPITDEQRTAYQQYEDKCEEYQNIIAKTLMNYINENLHELAEHWLSARRIDKMADLAKVVTPKTLLFKQDGTTLWLMECAWDIENGVAVKLSPELAVGSQDLFL